MHSRTMSNNDGLLLFLPPDLKMMPSVAKPAQEIEVGKFQTTQQMQMTRDQNSDHNLNP